jgi:glutamine synthetase
MGGLLTHARAITALTNPIINSYKRLISGYDAPSYVTWSTKNSDTFIKVPATRGQGTMLELRSPDSSCNPYLALAVILKSGLDGIRKGLNPQNSLDDEKGEEYKPQKADIAAVSLPNNLEEAIKSLMEDEELKTLLGDYVYKRFMEAKIAECREYQKIISPWEIEQYLTKF